MSQSISRRSFLKCAGSGAVSFAAALLTGVSAAAQQPCRADEPALLDDKAAVELLGYAPAPELGCVLVYLSVENLSSNSLPVGASYLQSREVRTRADLFSMGTGLTASCSGQPVRCGSFAAPLYGENAADASIFTLNLCWQFGICNLGIYDLCLFITIRCDHTSCTIHSIFKEQTVCENLFWFPK